MPCLSPRPRPVQGGVTQVKTRAEFDRLAARRDKPGASFAPTVKILITGIDAAAPQIYFIDGKAFDYHCDFMVKGLALPRQVEAVT